MTENLTFQNDPDIFGKILEMDIPHSIVPFPRIDPTTNTNYEYAVVILSGYECSLASANAEKKTRKILKENIPLKGEDNKGYSELYNTFLTAELLYLCCRHKNNLKRHLFTNPELVLSKLNMDEIAILMNHYYTNLSMYSGVVHEGSIDFEATIKKLQESGEQGAYYLNFFSLDILKTFIMYMVNR